MSVRGGALSVSWGYWSWWSDLLMSFGFILRETIIFGLLFLRGGGYLAIEGCLSWPKRGYASVATRPR